MYRHDVQRNPDLAVNSWALFHQALSGQLHQKHSVACLQDRWHLPLHIKDVPLINATANSLILPQFAEQWNRAWSLLNDVEAAARASTIPQQASLAPSDISLLLEANYIREISSSETPIAYAKAFSVEEKGCRRRFILWPGINQDPHWFESCFWGALVLPTVEEQIAAVDYAFAMSTDVHACFSSFPLPPESQLNYTFLSGNRRYVPLRIPTGARQSPALAQALILSLAMRAASEACIFFSVSPIQVNVFIDNIRFAGNESHVVQMAMHNFLRSSEAVGLRCEAPTFSPCYTFLGIVYDHSLRAIYCSEKSLSKLPRRCPEAITLRDGLSLLGRLMWISQCTALQPFNYYAAVKCIRRRISSGASLDDYINLWPCATSAFDSWIIAALQNPPRICMPLRTDIERSPHATIYSDASLSGWGAVVYYKRSGIGGLKTTFCFGGSWPPHLVSLHINILEGNACRNAVTQLLAFLAKQNLPSPASMHFVVDNTTWAASLKRRTASLRTYHLSWLRQSILSVLASSDIATYSVQWIATSHMPADILTRLGPRAPGETFSSSLEGFHDATLPAITAAAIEQP